MPNGTLCAYVCVCVCVFELCVAVTPLKPTEGSLIHRRWLPSQTDRGASWRWVAALSVCDVVSVARSQCTIWVMVGIRGRVVAVDFSAFCSAVL